MPDSAEPIIHTSKLTRHFGAVRAVEDLDLSVPAGSIFGFLGPNGAGKTTTIRLLLGIVDATRGDARVFGLSVAHESAVIRHRCGVVLEHSGLYERLTVRENLEFQRRSHGLSRALGDERICMLLDRFGLWEWRDRSAGTLSRGMKQKLAVARAMLTKPALVFLDEPTNGLDPESSRDLRDHILELARDESVTFFLTTHQLAEVERMCSHIGVLRAGRLRSIGDLDCLRSFGGDRHVRFVGHGFSDDLVALLEARAEILYVRRTSDTLNVFLQDQGPVAPLVTLLVSNGVALEAVVPVVPTLESGYLALMDESK